MSKTIIEKIISNHAGRDVRPDDIVDVVIDARVARDFGGANVVKNIQDSGLGVADPARTFFTFDCNPGGSDQNYAKNQQLCRVFARERGIRIYDIDAGIGTHLAVDEGLVGPGETFVSTDSHANILGAIGAFGQGMGDQDIAHAFAHGTVWFKVPPTIKITLTGEPGPHATPKDVTLALCKHFGANGLLGYAAELYGPYIDGLSLAGRMTLASLCTEMGGIIMLFPPNDEVIEYCRRARERRGNAGARFPSRAEHARIPIRQEAGRDSRQSGCEKGFSHQQPIEQPQPTRGSAATVPVQADPDATYAQEVTIDIGGLQPLISRPGNPEDVVPVAEVAGTKVDSVFIGSCTNGRFEDFAAAAKVLRGRRIAPGVVLKIVPSTDSVWRRLLDEGIVKVFKDAGALLGNAGCAGCAAGQIGQNGPGETTISTGNRNFPGKQGKGNVYLASPETAAACAVAGVITTVDKIPAEAVGYAPATVSLDGGTPRPRPGAPGTGVGVPLGAGGVGVPPARPTKIRGRVWVIRQDNIDTDMIFHNRYLTITDIKEMGKYAFDNLKGWEDFAKKAKPGDIVVTGKNFGCGSSRQQAVDCFQSLGVVAIIAESFGAIYERNAINAGLAILNADAVSTDLENGEEIEVDFETGAIVRLSKGQEIKGQPFPDAQMTIYRRGGLLAKA